MEMRCVFVSLFLCIFVINPTDHTGYLSDIAISVFYSFVAWKIFEYILLPSLSTWPIRTNNFPFS